MGHAVVLAWKMKNHPGGGAGWEKDNLPTPTRLYLIFVHLFVIPLLLLLSKVFFYFIFWA